MKTIFVCWHHCYSLHDFHLVIQMYKIKSSQCVRKQFFGILKH